MPTRRSAAFVLGIIVIVGFIVGALILSVIDPFAQGLLDSQLWTAETTEGQNALGWYKNLYLFIPVALLTALLIQVWIDTRQPT